MDIGSNTVSCLNRRKNTKNIKKSKNTVDNHRNLWYKYSCDAEVAELADAQASGACGSNTVRVQVPPSAFFCFLKRIAGMNKRVRPKGLGSFLYGGFEKPPRNITRGKPSVLRQSPPLVSPLPEHARK